MSVVALNCSDASQVVKIRKEQIACAVIGRRLRTCVNVAPSRFAAMNIGRCGERIRVFDSSICSSVITKVTSEPCGTYDIWILSRL